MKLTIDYLRKNGLIAYEYVRGSHAYGLATPKSDRDIGGVFIIPKETLFGLRSEYVEQVDDERHDTVFYELGRWVELLMKSNPTALESLFIPEDCIVGDIHPAVQYILDNRDVFVTQAAFKPMYGYSVSQIVKARGLNKKIVNPITERKDILDFCYTLKNQGTQPIKEFLKENKLDQRYCGLVKLPNMKDGYGVYYDFAAYFKFENVDWYDVSFQSGGVKYPWSNFISEAEADKIVDRIRTPEFFGYSGIVHPDEITKSNEVRLSSIPKGEKPICIMSYNKDAYTCHCRDYHDYKEWEAHRNPVRYESNLGHNYDAKNMSHCMRLTRMAKELASGEGFNVRRTWDRQYLLDIKNHKFEYEELIEQIEKEKDAMEEAIANCKLPLDIDYNKANEILLEARRIAYGGDLAW